MPPLTLASLLRHRVAARVVVLAVSLGVLMSPGCSDFVVDGPADPPEARARIDDLARVLPTFHLEADPAATADLFERFEDDLEIPARVSLWRGDRLVLDRERAEIQIKGGHSRHQPLKSLGVKLDDATTNEGGAVMSVPALLDGHRIDRLKSFRLRNGGGDFSGTMLKDLAYARLVAGSGAAVVPYYGEPAAAFVNDEFYGLLNLRTEGNANGLSRLLDVDKSSLQIAELDGGETAASTSFIVKDGDPRVFRALEAAIAAGDRAGALALVDEASFMDFVLVGTLFAVWDWPYRNARVYAVAGGPIRFCAFDFDEASRLHVNRGIERHMRERPANPLSDLFFLALGDPGFERRFWDRRDALIASGKLAPAVMRAQFESLAAVLAPAIDHQIRKYGVPASRAEWYLNLERHVEQYERRYVAFASEVRP